VDIYVGNLPYSYGNQDLEALFSQHGSVTSARVVMDRETGRSRGFGFVEMPNDAEAQAAMAALNGTQVQGRALTVNQSKPRDPASRPMGGGGGGYRGGGGGGQGRGGGTRW
jgi:RNA recognition motif-containing protein